MLHHLLLAFLFPVVLDFYLESLLGLLGLFRTCLRLDLGLLLLGALVVIPCALRFVNVNHLHVRADIPSVRYQAEFGELEATDHALVLVDNIVPAVLLGDDTCFIECSARRMLGRILG